MEGRTIEINLISARDLKDVNLFSKARTYAVAWVNGDPRRTKHRTAVDKENGTNPNWNQTMSFTVDEGLLQQGRLVLEVEIRCEGTFGDKDLGRVTVPLKEFANRTPKKAGNGVEFVSYQVRKSSGKAKGTLNLSLKMGDKGEIQQPQNQTAPTAPTAPYQYPAQGSYAANGGATNKNNNEPVTAYPAYPLPGSSSSSSYPPPPPQPPGGPYPPPGWQYPPPPYPPGCGHYPPPPPPPYQQGGYPPPQGYPPYYQGYPSGVPQQQKPPRKNKMGMGLGAGLLGGALGGLLIGDIIGDSYDGGFGDGGDFGGGDFGGGDF